MIYLNNAATSFPMAPGIAEAVAYAMNIPPVHPGRAASRVTDCFTDCRQRLARHLNVPDLNSIVLAPNATHALNLAIAGYKKNKPIRIVSTVTEHNSVIRPISHRIRDHGGEAVWIGCSSSGILDIEAFKAAFNSTVDLVVINHASNVTGMIADAGTFFRYAKSKGAVTILDASQTMGVIPVDADALSADIVVFTGHKGLLGTTGTGGMYVSPDVRLEPLTVGGTGIRSDRIFQPDDMPARLECGTPNAPAFAGLSHALDWLEKNSDSNSQTKTERYDALRAELAGIPKVRIYDDGRSANAGIVSFTVEGWRTDDIGEVLGESYGIVCRTGLHCAPLIHTAIGSAPDGTVRFSVSGFNSESDIDSAIQAIRTIAK